MPVPNMRLQMVGSGETHLSLTVRTPEGAEAGVASVMASQLVAARKSPLTLSPITHEGLLPRMGAHVRLEVRTLAVDLGAVGMAAFVRELRRRTLWGGGGGVSRRALH